MNQEVTFYRLKMEKKYSQNRSQTLKPEIYKDHVIKISDDKNDKPSDENLAVQNDMFMNMKQKELLMNDASKTKMILVTQRDKNKIRKYVKKNEMI